MNKTSSLVLATAVCALFATHAKADDTAAPAAKAKKASGVECSEKNSCSGKGSCKSAANACGGKNSCANHTFEAKSAKACSSKKGTVKTDAPADKS